MRQWRRRYLLDVWVEPRAVETLPAIVRGRVRDMTSEEETYVGSIAEVAAVIEAALDAGDVRPRHWERDREA